jgi:NAD(P)-dependent dehydrogenase (short-subunit alcohol dehydrogenase family)
VYGTASGLKPEGATIEDYRRVLIDEAAQATPLGRIAQSEDVAPTAAYLSSAESDFMTGLAINVAGGHVQSNSGA